MLSLRPRHGAPVGLNCQYGETHNDSDFPCLFDYVFPSEVNGALLLFTKNTHIFYSFLSFIFKNIMFNNIITPQP